MKKFTKDIPWKHDWATHRCLNPAGRSVEANMEPRWGCGRGMLDQYMFMSDTRPGYKWKTVSDDEREFLAFDGEGRAVVRSGPVFYLAWAQWRPIEPHIRDWSHPDFIKQCYGVEK